MNRRFLFLFFAFDWLLLNLLPFALTPAYSQLLWWRHLQQFPLMLTLLFVALGAWICFEFVFLSLVFSYLKTQFSRTKNKFVKLSLAGLGGLLVLSLAIYFLLVIASWVLFQKRGTFITPETVNLFWFVEDTAIPQLFSNTDLAAMAAVVALSLILSLSLLVLAPTAESKNRRRNTLLLAIALFVLSVGAGRIPYYGSSQETLFRLRSTARNFISPRYSLFGANLLLNDDGKPYEGVELSLRPQYSLEAYRANSPEPKSKPNFIVIVVEGMRADVIGLIHQGKEVTPTFNRIAKSGHDFKQAYAQSPETDYSLTSILTGLYPLRKPYRDLNFEINYPVTRVYDILKLYGYRTALLASLWTSSHRLFDSPSLDLSLDPPTLPLETIRAGITDAELKNFSRFSPAIGDRYSIDQLKEWLRVKNNNPFAAFVYLFSPHFSYPLPDGEREVFVPAKLDTIPSFLGYPAELVPIMKNRYYNTLYYADSLIQDLEKFIRASRPNEETVFIITGDHGQMFNEHNQVAHSGPLYNEAIHVPLIISTLSNFTAANTYQTPVALLDIGPTILNILGLPPHANFQGTTLLRELANISHEASTAARPIFSSVQVFSFEDAIISWPWKYTINHVGRQNRLHNLATDYEEQQNLVDTNPELAEQLEAELRLFRNSQLTYYGDASSAKLNYFPPQYPATKTKP